MAVEVEREAGRVPVGVTPTGTKDARDATAHAERMAPDASHRVDNARRKLG
jgi:hypothetical protein